MILRLVLLLLTGALTGCLGPGSCTTNVVPGVEVIVRDAVTDDFLSVPPRGVVREGTYQDSLQVLSYTADVPQRITELYGASERAGRYTVHLEAAGYQLWDTAGVNVAESDCHVRTARFTARLTPAT